MPVRFVPRAFFLFLLVVFRVFCSKGRNWNLGGIGGFFGTRHSEPGVEYSGYSTPDFGASPVPLGASVGR